MSILRSILIVTVGFGAMSAQSKLNVVTTVNYLRDIAQRIGGEHVSAIALANPRQDPHYVTPTPRMNELSNDADLFVENGLGLDLWAKNVIDASGNQRIQPGAPGHLIATINVPVRELPTEVSRAWGDIHPQGNPHVWLDPLNAKIIAANIATKLESINPANAQYYRRRLEEFRDNIDAQMFGSDLIAAIGKRGGDILSRKAKSRDFEEWLRSKNLLPKLGGWMKMAQTIKGVKILTYHKTYGYFAERFGVQIVGELEEKPGIPPPPQRRDAIVEQVKRDGIKIILNDNFYSHDAAKYISSKTGANVFETYLDVGASEEVDSYERLIRHLLETIALGNHS